MSDKSERLDSVVNKHLTAKGYQRGVVYEIRISERKMKEHE